MAEQVNPMETQNLASQSSSKLKWGMIVIWSGLVVFLCIIGVLLYYTIKGSAAQGDRAPAFTLTTFDGQEISSASLEGKVVVINFWASWCNPCEEEAADLEAAWRYYEPGGQVVFLGVDYADTDPEAKAYLDKFEITYPNGPDLRGSLSQSFRIRGVPETYIIDQNGEIVSAKVGPFMSLAEIQAAIDPLLQPTQP